MTLSLFDPFFTYVGQRRGVDSEIQISHKNTALDLPLPSFDVVVSGRSVNFTQRAQNSELGARMSHENLAADRMFHTHVFPFAVK